MAPPTILAHKSAFLHAQTLQLSQGLAPSAGWRAAQARHDQGEDADANNNNNNPTAAAAARLTDKAVDEAVYKLNHKLQQHARRVYAPQATRNVAEQTDALFLGLAAEGRHDDDGGGDDENDEAALLGDADDLRQGLDLALDSAIAVLPPTWDVLHAAEATAHPSEAQRYAELQTTLSALAARRADTRARLERLRAMESLLRPFRNNNNNEDEEGAGAGGSNHDNDNQNNSLGTLQQNLVTRNGEVEKELERMRMLLVRVAGRVAQLPDRPGASAETVPDLDEVERDKVRSVLDSL